MEVKPGYKLTEVGVIPEDWDVAAVGDEFSIKLGKMLDSEKNVGVPKPFLGNRAVQWGRIDLTDIGVVKLSPFDLQRFRLRDGDLLVCEGGETGRCAIWHDPIEECYYQKALHRLRPKRGYNVTLMLNVLRRLASSGSLLNFVTQTSIAHLPKDKFETVPIPLPSTKAEQEAIAEALSDADGLIESLEKLLVKKRQLKQGAMQELLTGKNRLPGFNGEWQDLFVEDVILRFFCGPSPTCEERNTIGDSEWGVLKTTAITWDRGWDWTKHKTLPQRFWNQPDLEVKAGDVFVTKAGPRHRVGVTAWVDHTPKRIIASGKMIGLRPNLKRAVPLMLAAAIAATEAQAFLDQRTTGMAESQVNFENTALLRTPIRIPRIEEQTAIAAILSDMDAEIAALEAKLAKARELKQGMMQELLTGRIRLIKKGKM